MEESSRVRRKDTTKGPPLRILSLDGGGVRGYSVFIILQELMHRLFVEMEGRAPKRHEIPKPCDHFDLIGGTGTGGLIAIMLGRLRLDIDTCKDVYVRMTRRVFQTDKTIAGIPYKRTLFKASKLEEAIRECVREHTIFEDEGNDFLSNAVPMTTDIPARSSSSAGSDRAPRRTMSQSSRYSQIGFSPTTSRMSVQLGSSRFGNPNALLYDTRENRTKTAVTAVFKGTRGSESTVLLRSYDSRKEPAPDVNCTIWQAGRATSATGLAFKPIQIGQYVYHDDGSGKFNPAPMILDEAVQNEWPGREIGVFVSIGTGKRPGGTDGKQHEWWEGFMGGTMGDFAEARRRLMAKIEGCEDTHQSMMREYLSARGVKLENYYRFNVEVGVGEFGMNEWNRLSDISTNTRMYLSKNDVQTMNINSAAKLAKINTAKNRQGRAEARRHLEGDPWPSGCERSYQGMPQSPSNPMAVELPGDEPLPGSRLPHYPPRNGYEHRPSIADQKYTVLPDDEYAQAGAQRTPPQRPVAMATPPYNTPSSTTTTSYGPQQSLSVNSAEQSPRVSHESFHRPAAPPLPPKTPLPYPDSQPTSQANPAARMNDTGRWLPYPDVDGPPPTVNTANKPQIRR